jgi:hypothetical protein
MKLVALHCNITYLMMQVKMIHNLVSESKSMNLHDYICFQESFEFNLSLHHVIYNQIDLQWICRIPFPSLQFLIGL